MLYLLDIDNSDYEDEIDLEVLLMTRICEIHEESVIMIKVLETCKMLLSTPNSVLRPYQQPFVTVK